MTDACGQDRSSGWAPPGLLAQRETRLQGWLLQAGLRPVGWVLSRPGLKLRSAIVCSHFKTAQSSIPVQRAVLAGGGFQGMEQQHQTPCGDLVKFPVPHG